MIHYFFCICSDRTAKRSLKMELFSHFLFSGQLVSLLQFPLTVTLKSNKPKTEPRHPSEPKQCSELLTLSVRPGHGDLLLHQVELQVLQHLAAQLDGGIVVGEEVMVHVLQQLAQHVLVVTTQKEPWKQQATIWTLKIMSNHMNPENNEQPYEPWKHQVTIWTLKTTGNHMNPENNEQPYEPWK